MRARPLSEAKHPDLRASVSAMNRAAELAREIASTSLVVVINGQVVRIPAKELREAAAKKNKTSV